ncbi:MAG: hypothetical protein ABIG44_03420 [Planctomycetota bacterium]
MSAPVELSDREAHDCPRAIAPRIYDDATHALWERLQPYCPQATVYRFGAVTVPGVSDLDLVVVFPNDTAVPMATLRIDAWMPEQRGVFCHGPLIFDHNSFHNFPLVYPGAKLELVGGPDLPVRTLTAEQYKLLGLIMGVEFLPLRWSDYGADLMRRRISVRHALVQLASLRHTIRHLEAWGLRQENWQTFADDMEALRRRMVESCDMHALVTALRRAETIVRELMVAHDRLLDDFLGPAEEHDASHANAFLNGKRRTTLFTSAVADPELPVEQLLLDWKQTTWRGSSVYMQPVFSLTHVGSLRHIDALLADDPPYAAALCKRFLMSRTPGCGDDFDQRYVELVQERALLGWQRTSLRSMPSHGPLITGVGGPFWSNVQETVPSRGTPRQRLRAGAGWLLSIYQQRLMRTGTRRLLGRLAERTPGRNSQRTPPTNR